MKEKIDKDEDFQITRDYVITVIDKIFGFSIITITALSVTMALDFQVAAQAPLLTLVP